MKVELTLEEKNEAIDRIRDFFLNERDEDLGLIAASIILDFILEEIAPKVYNKGLTDAKTWFSRKLEDIDFAYDDIYK